ncbi:hypothetical protein [Nocardioides sp.]|uniref:WXG100-like domain-containing protein n=1 Tax=Nocardioides sp. TaxID=35761 RepID=UPI00271A4018|nr:hypothetical protein [Nocardioides sp.]MDO9456588.1 hypothetical protein [Nocardioides sp.]
MTRVDVDGVGYTQCSALLADANRWAAVHVDTLSSALAGSGAMAGDSSFASEFAAAYDEAAAATVGAFDDVVGGLGSLCRIAYCSFENHERAERSSIASTIVVSSEPSAMADVLYESASPAPPSSLGGDASFLPGWANVILDHIEGFVWPDADVDRLRSTAKTWRTAAAHLDDLVDLSGRAMLELFQERSPEVPLATNAIAGLRMGIRDLAGTCEQLATACDEYADAVEKQRDLILDLVKDLIRDAVLIAAAGFVLGLVTGGSTNAVAAWINSGKLAAEVPKFKAFVETLRLYAAGAANGLRTTTTAVAQVQIKLSRFRNAAPIRTWGHSAVLDGGALRRLRNTINNPKLLDPHLFRGMSRRDVRELVEHWPSRPSRDGVGMVFDDPINRGRQIRIMQGYARGSRPDIITTGDYVVVSQNGRAVKVALEGNPTL